MNNLAAPEQRGFGAVFVASETLFIAKHAREASVGRLSWSGNGLSRCCSWSDLQKEFR